MTEPGFALVLDMANWRLPGEAIARKDRAWDETARSKIRVGQLLRRLQAHALGELEMTTTQIKAAEVLLSKRLPSLTAMEARLEANVRQRVVSAEPIDDESWERLYGGGVGAPGGPAEGVH